MKINLTKGAFRLASILNYLTNLNLIYMTLGQFLGILGLLFVLI